MSEVGEFIIAGKALSELKVVELRKELETRNLPKSGNKKELYERLRNYLVSNYEESAEIAPPAQPDSNNGYLNLTEYRSLCEVQPAHSTSPQKQEPENPVSETSIEPEDVVVAAPLNEQKQDIVSEPPVVEEESLLTAQKIDSEENSAAEEDEEQQEQIVMVEEPMEEQITEPEAEQPSEENEEETLESQQQESDENVEQNLLNELEQDDEMQQTEPEEDVAEAQQEMEPSLGQNITVESVELEEAKQQSVAEEVLPANDELEDEEDEGSKDEKAADEELDYEEDVNENKSKVKVEHSFSPKVLPKETNENNNVAKVITEGVVVVDKDVKPNFLNAKTYTPEGFVRRKEPSPARNKPSKLLHIRNLKRPFTTKILFEMLSAFGSVQEDEFWIDNIKTNCIVKFETEEQAALARERLHNVVWPPSSDLSLIVEFSSEEKLARRRGDEVAPTTTAATTSTATITSSGTNEKLGLIVTVDNRKPDTDPMVRDKSHSRKRKASEEPKKQLEDLFRKTVAQPPVYYLPLSEAEAEKRWAEKIRKEAIMPEDRRRNGDNGRSDERRRHGSGGGRISSAAGSRHNRPTPDRFKRARRDSPPPRRRR